MGFRTKRASHMGEAPIVRVSQFPKGLAKGCWLGRTEPRGLSLNQNSSPLKTKTCVAATPADVAACGPVREPFVGRTVDAWHSWFKCSCYKMHGVASTPARPTWPMKSSGRCEVRLPPRPAGFEVNLGNSLRAPWRVVGFNRRHRATNPCLPVSQPVSHRW